MLDCNLPLSLCTDSLCFLLLVSNVLGFPYAFSKGVRTAASHSKVFFRESSWSFIIYHAQDEKVSIAYTKNDCLEYTTDFSLEMLNESWQIQVSTVLYLGAKTTAEMAVNSFFFFSISSLWRTEIPLEFRCTVKWCINFHHPHLALRWKAGSQREQRQTAEGLV